MTMGWRSIRLRHIVLSSSFHLLVIRDVGDKSKQTPGASSNQIATYDIVLDHVLSTTLRPPSLSLSFSLFFPRLLPGIVKLGERMEGSCALGFAGQ